MTGGSLPCARCGSLPKKKKEGVKLDRIRKLSGTEVVRNNFSKTIQEKEDDSQSEVFKRISDNKKPRTRRMRASRQNIKKVSQPRICQFIEPEPENSAARKRRKEVVQTRRGLQERAVH